MRIRWRGLELPHRVVAVEETLSETYGGRLGAVQIEGLSLAGA